MSTKQLIDQQSHSNWKEGLSMENVVLITSGSAIS